MKSLFKKELIPAKDREKLYELALKNSMHEGVVLWSSSQIFLLANTIITAFITNGLFDEQKKFISDPNPPIFVICLLGIIISFVWLGTYQRRSNYYKFRATQVRQREPENWNLMAGDGKNFADGDTIEICGEKLNLGFLGKAFRPNKSMPILITLFIIMYIVTIFFVSPFKVCYINF